MAIPGQIQTGEERVNDPFRNEAEFEAKSKASLPPDAGGRKKKGRSVAAGPSIRWENPPARPQRSEPQKRWMRWQASSRSDVAVA